MRMRVVPPALPEESVESAPVSLPPETPIDQALTLALSNELYAALRVAVAVIQRDPAMPTALCVAGRLLGELGHREAAREACHLAVVRAIDLENLPLAVASAQELGRFGGDPDHHLELIADAFCKGSPRLGNLTSPPPPLPPDSSFQPIGAHLTGSALVKEAVAILRDAKQKLEGEHGKTSIAPLQLFSAMRRDELRGLCAACSSRWIKQGYPIIEEGAIGNEAYFVARGDLEVRRRKGDDSIVLARLTNGAIFGEMALLARAPRAASVVATRPSIVIEVKRDALDELVERYPEVATELAAHCRERMVENLLRTSDVLKFVPLAERPVLVERFTTRVFEKNQRIILQEERPPGLYLIASGEVAVVRREGSGDPLVLSTLGPGEVVGEVAMVLRRKANADVIALQPTVTLFLPMESFLGLVYEHPAILAQLYVLAVRRDEETTSIIQEEASVAEDFVLL
jgi:CRP-like cAMP-binding protein